jgi:putative membrane protein
MWSVQQVRERLWRLTARWLASAGALWVASVLVSGIDFDGWEAVLAAAGIFTAVALLVRPLAMRVAWPLRCLTLGLFTWVVSAGMLALTAWVSGQLGIGFHVDGAAAAFVGALVVGLTSFLFEQALS